MRTELHPFVTPRLAPSLTTAPSLRVPVTAGNRAYLRWLRAAELSAWQEGRVWRSRRPVLAPTDPVYQNF